MTGIKGRQGSLLRLDLEEKAYKIVFYRGSKAFINMIVPKIKELFNIGEAEITKDE